MSLSVQARALAPHPIKPTNQVSEPSKIDVTEVKPVSSRETDKSSFLRSHALLRNTVLVGAPLLAVGANELMGLALEKTAEKAVTTAINKAMNTPAFIQATLDSPGLVKSFPALMGKGSTQVAAVGYTKALHTAVTQKVNSSVAMTMNQAIGAGSFMGTGNAVAVIEGKATQYTSKMNGPLSKYGKMFIDHFDTGKPQAIVQASRGGFTASATISTDINQGARFLTKSNENMTHLSEGAHNAAAALRKAPINQTTIVTPDMANKIATATETSVVKTSQTPLAKAHKFLTQNSTAKAIGVTVITGLTAWDTYHAVQKTQDENSSTAGKALAWTTVGLDVVTLGGLLANKPQLTVPSVILAVGASVANHVID